MYVVMSLGRSILVAFSSLLSASPPSYYPLLLSRLFKNHMLMVFIMYVCGGVGSVCGRCAYIRRFENNSQGLDFFFHHLGPEGDPSQVARSQVVASALTC